MADLPVPKRKDLHKVPKTTKDNVSGVIEYTDLAGFFFRENEVYTAGDVFFVDSNLNLKPGLVVTNANDDIITFDIKHNFNSVTVANPQGGDVLINIPAGRLQSSSNKNIREIPAKTGYKVEPIQAGGISWISLTIFADLNSNNSRAFDDTDQRAAMLCGVQNFGSGQNKNNIYFLGTSYGEYPLYSSSILFRNLGWQRDGLNISLDTVNGYLQISGGTISSWYEKPKRIKQTSQATFYYVYDSFFNQDFLTPVAKNVITVADMKLEMKGGANPTVPPAIGDYAFFHYVFLDPITLRIYIYICTQAISGTAIAVQKWGPVGAYAGMMGRLENYHAMKMFNEHCILLGCLSFYGANNLNSLNDITVTQLHNYLPGNGSGSHPSLPSPIDSPNGGRLKAKNNQYHISFDYDGYLISEATSLKQNHLFRYDDDSQYGLVEVEYQTASNPTTEIKGFGGYGGAYYYGNNWLYFAFFYNNNFIYVDPDMKGDYIGNYYVETSSINQSGNYVVFDSGMTTSSGIVYSNYIAIINFVQMSRQLANGKKFTTYAGGAKIPYINDGKAKENYIRAYNESLWQQRKANGGTDSMVIIEVNNGPYYIVPMDVINQQLYSLILNNNPVVAKLFQYLVSEIGSQVANEIKQMFEAVKKLGLLSKRNFSMQSIIGYFVENNSVTDQIESTIPGFVNLFFDSPSQSFVAIDKTNNFHIQPADVAGLDSGDVTPEQAVLFLLLIRTNFFWVYLQSDYLASSLFESYMPPSYQITELAV